MFRLPSLYYFINSLKIINDSLSVSHNESRTSNILSLYDLRSFGKFLIIISGTYSVS